MSASRPRPRNSPGPSVDVLRIGHRPGRDPRLTTHLALAARAFGAERLLLHPPDPELARRIDAVRARWGGNFQVEGCPDWKKAIRAFEGPVVHLTMYGLPLSSVRRSLRKARRLLVVAGGAKVPRELYAIATYNVAIEPQPHSEVAALAVFLDRLLGPPGRHRWKGAQQRIRPSSRGKRIEARPS
ncbi:MAG: tRNA (cytidine(56)-2'-O)-methyltransferase [Thermoplasmata archaeon]|nr:tRNA (cytidine(56)-2'-O)-methyltransferase [Thermoplasmata archaeon]